MRPVVPLFPSLLAGVLAVVWLTASPAAEPFDAQRDCVLWNYVVLVGASFIYELVGEREYAEAVRQAKAVCDRHLRGEPSPALDNHQFFKD